LLRYFWPSDDEQLAGQFSGSYFDEDAGWWVSVQQAGAVVALAAGLTLLATSTALATSVFSQSQDDPAGNLNFVEPVQEDYFQNPVAPVNWPQPSVILDTDQHPVFVSAFEADEDFWNNSVAPVWSQNYLGLPLVVPEDFPAFPASNPVLDDGGLWAPQIPSAELDWNVLFFLDDGSWVPAMQPDEDFLPTSALPAPYNWPWPQQAFQSSDEDQLVIQFVAAEDPVWLQLVQPVQDALRSLQQWPFEQHEPAGNLSSFTEELYWQNPVPPVPGAMWLLRQDAFEQTDATGALFLDLDEGLPGPLPAPVQQTFVPLQPWFFEQNEPAFFLTIIHEEDLWNNPVAPVNWTPPFVFSSVTAYDEVMGQTPNTGQDEDFWNYFVTPSVAPVPDQMLLRYPYLPDVEEIPAGSLVPFIPPPPQLCPLPPCGPDPDICISIFQNKGGGPVLALFCRTCMSGLPLVVRGDYAIWCQTCCAFVSKDTTYMGTTQAPGQFKARF
jgi:hypothetical protein